jgi:predicted outer membrane lipoprotein
MLGPRIGGVIRFLIGILLLQVATALLTYTALMTDLNQTGWLFGALAATLGVLVALWFDSVIGSVKEQTMARQQKRHAREREKLRQQAEKDKIKLAKQHRRRAGGATLKTGLAVGGVVGVGVAMMFAQLMTLGLLTISAAGGAALGYGIRSRQERLIRAREQKQAEKLIYAQQDLPALTAEPQPTSGKRRKPTLPAD